tara:strand:+ start:159 stop:524 length:366 start_codon:yes stop_codon:yes gene_type:complete
VYNYLLPNTPHIIAYAIVAFFVVVFMILFWIASRIIRKVFRDNHQAMLYRQMMLEQARAGTPEQVAEAATAAAGPQWELTHMDGRKKKTVNISAETESEALAQVGGLGLSYAHIVDIKQIS